MDKLWELAEVDQQSKLKSGSMQVIDRLCSMCMCEGRYGLDLNDDLPKTNEIRSELLRQFDSFVGQRQFRLSHERNSLQGEFVSQALLINRFCKSKATVVINLETCPNDFKALIFVNQIGHLFSLFASIRVIRGQKTPKKRLSVGDKRKAERQTINTLAYVLLLSSNRTAFITKQNHTSRMSETQILCCLRVFPFVAFVIRLKKRLSQRTRREDTKDTKFKTSNLASACR